MSVEQEVTNALAEMALGRPAITLKARGWITVTGRGRIANFHNSQVPTGMRARDLVDRRIIIDGKLYEVRALEQLCNCKSCGFGLIVRETGQTYPGDREGRRNV